MRNHAAALDFMSALMRRHTDTFQIIPSFYFPCPAEDLPSYEEIESKRTSPALYIDYLICTKILPRWKVFSCPMIAPNLPRYKVKPKDWSELTYEVNRGELRMEVYISFLSFIGSAGSMVLNLFGGLKPIAAALVSPIFATFTFQLLPINIFFTTFLLTSV